MVSAFAFTTDRVRYCDCMNMSAMRQQKELVVAIAACLRGDAMPVLCIAGPVGCGQDESVEYLASKLRSKTKNRDLHIHAMIPEELSWNTPAQSVEALREAWAKADGGILYIHSLENIFADANALPILETLRILLAAGATNVSLVIAGDVQAVAHLQAANPDLYNYFTHATVKALSPKQIGELIVQHLKNANVQSTENFKNDLERNLRSAVGMGNLRNSRVAHTLAADLINKAGSRSIDIRDLDLSVIKLDKSAGNSDGYEQLDSLIGLTDVKNTVKLWINNASLLSRREQLGLNTSGMGQHMIFKGPAGTAKTTVARIVGQMLAQTGGLASGHVVEVQKGDIISDMPDQTARRVIELVKRSIGGVLFIDEAYTLTNLKGERDAGREAIDTLLKTMEDHRDEFVVIAAGYPSEMEQFLNSNPGLRSRFVRVVEFPAYSSNELCLILTHLASERGYTIDPAVFVELEPRLKLASKYPGFGNGRHVRNQLETAIMRQGDRVTALDDDTVLRTLTVSDFADAIRSTGIGLL